MVDFLIGLAKNKPDLKLTYMVHDYFGVCPIYTLLDYNIKYCGVPSDLSYCDKCLQLNPLMNVVAPLVRQDYPDLTMNEWREHFGDLLACVSRIVCFSQSLQKRSCKRAYPQLPDEKIDIAPHAVDWVRPVDIHKSSKQLNIAVVGHLEVQKGAQIVSLLATYVDYYNLNILIHVFGEIFEPNESFGFLKKTRQAWQVYENGFAQIDGGERNRPGPDPVHLPGNVLFHDRRSDEHAPAPGGL